MNPPLRVASFRRITQHARTAETAPNGRLAPAQLSPGLPIVAAVAAVFALVMVVWLGGKLLPRSCSDLAQERTQVAELLAQGKTATAIDLAESALARKAPAPCPGAREKLALIWYAASMDELFRTARVDVSAALQAPTRWLRIDEQAQTYGVPGEVRLRPEQVFAKAVDAGIWPLADAAFKRASWPSPVTLEVADTRYAVLRNFGHQLAFHPGAQMQPQGVRLLATAHAIAVAYKLPRAEACLDLQRLGYADCSEPAPDALDPVLLARNQGRDGRGDR